MLDPSADEIRDWGNSAIQLMADYLGDLRDRGIVTCLAPFATGSIPLFRSTEAILTKY